MELTVLILTENDIIYNEVYKICNENKFGLSRVSNIFEAMNKCICHKYNCLIVDWALFGEKYLPLLNGVSLERSKHFYILNNNSSQLIDKSCNLEQLKNNLLDTLNENVDEVYLDYILTNELEIKSFIKDLLSKISFKRNLQAVDYIVDSVYICLFKNLSKYTLRKDVYPFLNVNKSVDDIDRIIKQSVVSYNKFKNYNSLEICDYTPKGFLLSLYRYAKDQIMQELIK